MPRLLDYRRDGIHPCRFQLLRESCLVLSLIAAVISGWICIGDYLIFDPGKEVVMNGLTEIDRFEKIRISDGMIWTNVAVVHYYFDDQAGVYWGHNVRPLDDREPAEPALVENITPRGPVPWWALWFGWVQNYHSPPQRDLTGHAIRPYTEQWDATQITIRGIPLLIIFLAIAVILGIRKADEPTSTQLQPMTFTTSLVSPSRSSKVLSECALQSSIPLCDWWISSPAGLFEESCERDQGECDATKRESCMSNGEERLRLRVKGLEGVYARWLGFCFASPMFLLGDDMKATGRLASIVLVAVLGLWVAGCHGPSSAGDGATPQNGSGTGGSGSGTNTGDTGNHSP